jgi:hypothetical protein
MFMPDRAALVTIKGLDDPTVGQVSARIQNDRAKARPAHPRAPALRDKD